MKYLRYLFIFATIILLVSCGSSFEKTPVDQMIHEMADQDQFTIILYDMDVEGALFKTYKHQYQIITLEDTVPKEKVTEWYEVSESFFEQNINNMGMEIASKQDGTVSKGVAPPGYGNYVGNSQYGEWRTNSSGESVWHFFAQYAMLSAMFNMMAYPAYQSSWNTYRTDYRGSNRPYYGRTDANGRPRYGTSSTYVANNRSKSTWNSKSSNRTFMQRVQNKTSRSGSRYSNSGSSSRSRSSGGFGK